MCKVNMDTETLIKRFPNARHLFTLRDRVGRNKSGSDVRILHQLCSFEIPASNIVNFSGSFIRLAFFINVDCKNICFLLFALQRIPHKRRIC